MQLPDLTIQPQCLVDILVGDAAHAHGGAFAAGGSLALDDSLALGLAFEEVSSNKCSLFFVCCKNSTFLVYLAMHNTQQPQLYVEAAFTAVVEQLEGAQRQVRLAGPETKRDGEIQLSAASSSCVAKIVPFLSIWLCTIPNNPSCMRLPG
jgi:hypothetical protein